MPLFPIDVLRSSNGVRKTRSLFKEVCKIDDVPVMSLSHNVERLDSMVPLRPIYLGMVVDDPTEYDFADYVFGDYTQWVQISESTWMKDYLDEWRMVADVQRKQKAFKALLSEIDKGGRNAYGAARFFIEEPWKAKTQKVKVKESTEKAAGEFTSDIIRLQEHFGKL